MLLNHQFLIFAFYFDPRLTVCRYFVTRGTFSINSQFRDLGDVDFEAKLEEWERFYNFHRPHDAFNVNTLTKRTELT